MINPTFEIRLKVDDILNLGEKDIMELLFEIMGKVVFRKIIFWHNEVPDSILEKFMNNWKKNLEERDILFKFQDKNTINNYVWFDILNETDNEKKFRHRFKCVINGKMELIRALFSYYNTVTFVKESAGRKIKHVKESSNES